MEQEIARWLQLDPESRMPPFEQIKQSILAAANSGQVAVGTRLPAVRALAAHLGIATNTVARAYRELEQAGVVETKGRAGTVITAGGDDARRRVASAADEFAAVVRSAGLLESEAVAIARAALRRA
ncbi:MAG: Transcriptional regulator, GntR family [Micrococcaceae bacterium]|uniref:GntR family transcriptional regulator n=1 Tax=Arthrobacter TaxID=1663 RepID=UPI001F2EF433|nr:MULTISPECIES: GntR family transcriptional regulator [Arthrobacter]MCU1632899.1 Transcriptional regulator, GntR family [Micrococcaceae bacterium]MEC5199688.1 DNA-binding transcriptional regulator YhcF (GntR family) [Arthrobacter sp. PL16]